MIKDEITLMMATDALYAMVGLWFVCGISQNRNENMAREQANK